MAVEVFLVCDLCGLREPRDEAHVTTITVKLQEFWSNDREFAGLELDHVCKRCTRALMMTINDRVAELKEVS